MARRKSRRPIGPASGLDLAVIAGFPAPAHAAAVALVEAQYPRWRAISTPFKGAPGALYNDRRAVFDLVKTACRFAADLGAETTPPRPGRLVLFYAEDASAPLLLEAFGYGALPVRLSLPDWRWPHGQHWNRIARAFAPLLDSAVAATETGPLQRLRLRLERAISEEALLLPPRNFIQPDREPLALRFDRLRREGRLAEEVFDDLEDELFDWETLPRFFSKVPEPANVFRIDRRGLVFARSMRGQHGFERLKDFEAARDVTEFRIPLESAFRFGTPVRNGFQHDVQWPGEGELANEAFQDVETGEKLISGTHANIYTTDRVR